MRFSTAALLILLFPLAALAQPRKQETPVPRETYTGTYPIAEIQSFKAGDKADIHSAHYDNYAKGDICERIVGDAKIVSIAKNPDKTTFTVTWDVSVFEAKWLREAAAKSTMHICRADEWVGENCKCLGTLRSEGYPPGYKK